MIYGTVKHYLLNKATACKGDIKLIQEVFLRLKREPLNGVKYSVYLMGKNVFIHTVQFADREAGISFGKLDEFIIFRSSLNERLLEKPITNKVREIGTFIPSD